MSEQEEIKQIEIPEVEFTLEELSKYNGLNSDKKIWKMTRRRSES